MWTLGTLIAFPLALLVGFLVLAIGVGLIWSADSGSYVDRDDRTAGAGAVIVALIIFVAIAIGMYPYDAAYHQWQKHDGTITRIDKRLVSSGDKSMEDKFVVTFAGSDQQYGCLDTRCASLRVGDYLSLRCKRVWEYGATDGYDCKFDRWQDQTGGE